MFASFLAFLKEWWHVLTGILAGLWWVVRGVRRNLREFKQSITKDHPTCDDFDLYRETMGSDMEDCRMTLLEQMKLLLQEHEQDEFARMETFEAANNSTHAALMKKQDELSKSQDRVESKIDHLKDILLEKHL